MAWNDYQRRAAPAVVVRDLAKSYGDEPAVRGVNFEVPTCE